MSNINKHIMILGGGQAAAFAASTIRQYDKNSTLTLISEEKFLPYERPPLSKDYLLNKMTEDQCLFFDENFYINNNIEIINNEKIINVDFSKFNMTSNKNNEFSFDKLIIATGSSNNKIKIKNIKDEDMFYLRSISESINIKQNLEKSKSILIIGGGFIGLELASSAIQLGKKTTVVELGSQLMGRIVPTEIAKIIEEKHKENGVNFHFNTSIESVIKNTNNYEIKLKNNHSILVDMIIVGVGSKPNIDIFENSKLKLDNGIVTNEFCETSVENIYAAGDVTNFYHPLYKTNIRLESWKHAQNHGVIAGNNIVGKKTAYSDIPWMWSDQYDLNLQLTGKCDDYDSIAKRGFDEKTGVVYFFLKNRKITGACGVGVGGKIGKDIRLGGKLAEKKIIVNKEILSDPSQKLNKII